MNNKKFGLFSSSVNPEQLSATVSGAILALASGIIALGSWFGISIAQTQIAELAQNAGMAVGSLWFLFGIVRKVVAWVSKR